MNEVEILSAQAILRGIRALPNFEENMDRVISRAFEYVLDGEAYFDDLEGCEKTILGTKIEKYFLRQFGLPTRITKSKAARMVADGKEVPKSPDLDTEIEGFGIDIKVSTRGKYMIPTECIGRWVLCVHPDYDTHTYSMFLARATPEMLNKGKNKDQKTNFKVAMFRKYACPIILSRRFTEDAA